MLLNIARFTHPPIEKFCDSRDKESHFFIKSDFMRGISIRFSILLTFTLLVIVTVGGIAVTFQVGVSKVLVDLYSHIIRSSAQRVIERTVSFLDEPAKYNRLVADFFVPTGRKSEEGCLVGCLCVCLNRGTGPDACLPGDGP